MCKIPKIRLFKNHPIKIHMICIMFKKTQDSFLPAKCCTKPNLRKKFNEPENKKLTNATNSLKHFKVSNENISHKVFL